VPFSLDDTIYRYRKRYIDISTYRYIVTGVKSGASTLS